ncbi:MAG: AsmA-like C-terminal region-containing protein [Candidatus Accumulibacter sp.]|uniref:AsmA-like C-terminal region-containing protein n=1 Tax=Accumulibacter sp. TaxID=2053492 RepID=UPI00287A06B0|nr:AsmA-like C-terminal region-containing protein [Accumulibacter sp.]MDS4014268.1 AsmA-like C-terminal region-containing protein [Accumulibacter sp.]
MDPDLIDPNLVYAKTASGEEAVLQRTRVVQRNTRMVLILVDGNATVAELCEKTGNPQMTRSALLELESDGLVDRRAAFDSVWQRGDKARRHSASDETTAPVSEFSSFGAKEQTAPPPSSAGGSGASDLVPAREETAPPPAKSHPPIVHDPSPSESGTVFLSRAQAGGTPSPVPVEDVLGPLSVPQRWRPAWFAGERQQPPVLVSARRPRFLITWPLLVILLLLLPVVLALVLMLIFPYLNYQPAVEALLTQSTGRKARVDALGIDLLPIPALRLDGVRLEGVGEAVPLAVDTVRVQPVLTTLFAERMLFDEVELSGLVLAPTTFVELAQMLKSAASPAARAGVRHVSLSNTELALAGLTIGDLRGEVVLSAAGLLEVLALHSANRDLTFEARPLDTAFAIRAEGLKWRPRANSPQVVDSFLLQGELRATLVTVDRMEFRVFDGLLTGKAALRAGGDSLLLGEVAFDRINARKLSDALGLERGFLGEGTGRLRFSAAADAWPSLLSTLQGEGTFTVKRGSLPGIDLPEALRRAPSVPLALGGATRFEQLSGAVRLTPGFVHLSRLNLSAGAMQSAGYLDIGRDLDLRGRMDVEMRGRGERTALPVAISGSLNAPLLKTVER